MGAFKHLSEYFGESLIDVAYDMGYSEANIQILSGDVEGLRTRNPDIYANLLSCRHNKDGRSFIEYGQDVVASWLFEDHLLYELNRAGLRVVSAGADRNRVILPSSKVSASSDFTVLWRGREIPLELMNDYTGYWYRYCKIDLRDDKYSKMKEKKSLFLGISTSDHKYVLLNFSRPIKATYIASHRYYYGKPVSQISIDRNQLLAFDMMEVIEDIKREIELT